MPVVWIVIYYSYSISLVYSFHVTVFLLCFFVAAVCIVRTGTVFVRHYNVVKVCDLTGQVA